jgi:trehalose 6-phosphate synthase
LREIGEEAYSVNRIVSFVLILIVGLAGLTWAASFVVERTVAEWSRRDLNLRAQVVTRAASRSLLEHWTSDPQGLHDLLTDLTQDERVVGAAACDRNLSLLGKTGEFPEDATCQAWAGKLEASADKDRGFAIWDRIQNLFGGNVHVSAVRVEEGNMQVGFLVLVQDMSFLGPRSASTQAFLLIAFGFLAAAAAAVTLVVARFSRRGWSTELRDVLRGKGPHKPEFQPILRDVQELVDRLTSEHASGGGAWTADRLKLVLNRFLQGERVIVVANREPYIHERSESGEVTVRHPASGLVTALEPVMEACSGVWIAHGTGSADRETVDKRDRVRVPPGDESYFLRRIWLTEEEEAGYYYGVANEGLWPLCHIAHARPTFRAEDWTYYERVNRRFAEAVLQEVDSDDPIILVQDYHFALLPRMIRQKLPRATVIMFWHIPWPNAESFGICPYRNEILEGMLGSSIIGFHTQFHCNNFLDSVDRYLESRIDREEHAVIQRGNKTLVRPYPISLEWPVKWLETVPDAEECRRSVWEELGLAPDALLGVGVDRLDYTKGVEERLLAVERMLERHPEFRGRFSFVQVAAPSRTKIERYQRLNEQVEVIAERVNARFGSGFYQPIILRRTHHEPPVVYRFYRAAHLCYVSSLHDGMNLVAKEFVASREDLQGVLVLSQFTGAARELTEALVVNPYDLEEASSALAAALAMPAEEQRERMYSMRRLLAEFNVYRWAGKMLVDAARLRSHDRLEGRLAEKVPGELVRIP